MTGKQLKALRATLELTQAELADRLGVTRNSVARWEIGKYPVPPMAERLLDALLGRTEQIRKALTGRTGVEGTKKSPQQ